MTADDKPVRERRPSSGKLLVAAMVLAVLAISLTTILSSLGVWKDRDLAAAEATLAPYIEAVRTGDFAGAADRFTTPDWKTTFGAAALEAGYAAPIAEHGAVERYAIDTATEFRDDAGNRIGVRTTGALRFADGHEVPVSYELVQETADGMFRIDGTQAAVGGEYVGPF